MGLTFVFSLMGFVMITFPLVTVHLLKTYPPYGMAMTVVSPPEGKTTAPLGCTVPWSADSTVSTYGAAIFAENPTRLSRAYAGPSDQ